MNFDLERGPAGDAYKLLVGLVAPRPIALITSMDEQGWLNAAPFSAYNYLCTDPPIIGVGVTNRPDQRFVPKDTARNIRRTGEFVVNVVTEDIAEKMNICATDFPPEMSEVELAGFTTAPSQVVSRHGWQRRTRPSNAANTRRWRLAAHGLSWGAFRAVRLRHR